VADLAGLSRDGASAAQGAGHRADRAISELVNVNASREVAERPNRELRLTLEEAGC